MHLSRPRAAKKAGWLGPPQECQPPHKGGSMNTVPSCSKPSCGSCDLLLQILPAVPPSWIPGSGDAFWATPKTTTATVSTVPPMAHTVPGDCPPMGHCLGVATGRRRVWSQAGGGSFPLSLGGRSGIHSLSVPNIPPYPSPCHFVFMVLIETTRISLSLPSLSIHPLHLPSIFPAVSCHLLFYGCSPCPLHGSLPESA